jgi:hypothetical protein
MMSRELVDVRHKQTPVTARYELSPLAFLLSWLDNTPPASCMQIIRGKKLKQIFSDHWPDFSRKYKHFLNRPAIAKNIEKMLMCGTEAMGFHLWRCQKCLFEKKVFHTCKSRFCPSCGIAQTKRWKEQFNVLFANTTYKHIIFHPPSEFRDYFKIGKTPYFHMLFTTAHQTLQEWYAWKGYLPGIMAVIHTFGRDEKFTPHIGVVPALLQPCPTFIIEGKTKGITSISMYTYAKEIY